MANIVDKRFSPKDGSLENRQKFIDRYKSKIKEAIKKTVNNGSIKDFTFKDKKITIKSDDGLDIPYFDYDYDSGTYDHISVGNKKYQKGDKIEKPRSSGQSGRKGSKDGGGEDDFEFSLTEKEFSDLFFEDLELPELTKKQFTGDVYEIQRCGFSNTGGPSSLSLRQTIIRAFMRRFALKKKQDKEDDKLIVNDGKVIVKPKKKINFLEDVDLKYNHRDKVEIPSSRAVMFCMMDVSGSMGEREKDISKRFFLLLSLFLKRNYSIVDVVFIRHAEWAEECSEEIFFHDKASGGTVISTGYEKILEIIKRRYNPDQWNVYMAQCTDGDNFEYDNDHMINLLTKHLLPMVQYFAYIEVMDKNNIFKLGESDILKLLNKISKDFKNLAVRVVSDYKEIFQVFVSLFKKETKK